MCINVSRLLSLIGQNIQVQIIALFFSARYICNVALNASMNPNERSEEIDQVCIKCGRSIPVHPSTGRFHTVILHGRECAWNPDEEFKNFVVIVGNSEFLYTNYFFSLTSLLRHYGLILLLCQNSSCCSRSSSKQYFKLQK